MTQLTRTASDGRHRQVVVVTGASAGVGRATVARNLVARKSGAEKLIH